MSGETNGERPIAALTDYARWPDGIDAVRQENTAFAFEGPQQGEETWLTRRNTDEVEKRIQTSIGTHYPDPPGEVVQAAKDTFLHCGQAALSTVEAPAQDVYPYPEDASTGIDNSLLFAIEVAPIDNGLLVL